MLVRCPDCGKKVSASASSCPHCGAPVKELRRQNPPEDSSASAPYAPGKGFDFVGFLVRLIKGVLAVCAVLLILLAILFFAVRADLFGFRSGLRKIADSDSGTGSRVDRLRLIRRAAKPLWWNRSRKPSRRFRKRRRNRVFWTVSSASPSSSRRPRRRIEISGKARRLGIVGSPP